MSTDGVLTLVPGSPPDREELGSVWITGLCLLPIHQWFKIQDGSWNVLTMIISALLQGVSCRHIVREKKIPRKHFPLLLSRFKVKSQIPFLLLSIAAVPQSSLFPSLCSWAGTTTNLVKLPPNVEHPLGHLMGEISHIYFVRFCCFVEAGSHVAQCALQCI